MDRNSPERALQQTGSFPQACTRPERHGADRGIRLARRCPPRAPCTWLQARGSLHQLHAAPAPPLPSVPLPRPLICKILGFAGTLNPYGADSFPSKSSP